MAHRNEESFYLRWRKALAILFVALFVPIVYLAVANQHYEHVALALFNLTVAMVGIWFLSSISVSSEGVILYKINRLKWEDIKSVRRISLLGLPYILIKRHKGFSWWLPLYYEGKRNIEVALRSNAPVGNPLRDNVDAS